MSDCVCCVLNLLALPSPLQLLKTRGPTNIKSSFPLPGPLTSGFQHVATKCRETNKPREMTTTLTHGKSWEDVFADFFWCGGIETTQVDRILTGVYRLGLGSAGCWSLRLALAAMSLLTRYRTWHCSDDSLAMLVRCLGPWQELVRLKKP